MGTNLSWIHSVNQNGSTTTMWVLLETDEGGVTYDNSLIIMQVNMDKTAFVFI
jgi:hypothetical protein